MKIRSNVIALVVLLLATASPVVANIAPPTMGGSVKKSTVVPARMRVGVDSRGTEAKLVIPREIFLQLRAEIDGSDSQVAAGTFPTGLPPAQTAIAGLCLSLSLIAAGMWFVNSRGAAKKLPRVATALAFIAVGGVAATVVYANAGPPPVARSLTSRILVPEAMPYGASGDVKVEIVNNGSQIQLLLPAKAKDNEGE